MKKIIILIYLMLLFSHQEVVSQFPADTSVYLITCGTGTDTYSIYGHSALRIQIQGKKTDNVFNWGVFDFNTPNFAWKFAKGRLNYMILEESLQSFLRGYYYEKRYVYCQKLNLDPTETNKLVSLINENLKPENIYYSYDFFYDDCSTRIRDIIEKSVGDKLLYPPSEKGDIPSFRQMVGKYQTPFPWLDFGINLIMGSTADKEASFRDRMFLPLEMQKGLSETVVNRSGKMIPLLQNPQIILDFEPLSLKRKFLTSPVSVFTILLIIVIILSVWNKDIKITRIMDVTIFSLFSILAILLIFFNYFTDHQQMKWNLNIIWLNPLLIFCLVSLFLNQKGLVWFRLVFFISAAFILIQLMLPQEFDISFFILILIVLTRCLFRGEFEWNPLAPVSKKSA